MEDVLVPIGVVGILFIGLPWIILHYLTRWKADRGLSQQDEALLDELYEMSRRLDGRIDSIERILTADNPNWKAGHLADHSATPGSLPDNVRELRDERRR